MPIAMPMQHVQIQSVRIFAPVYLDSVEMEKLIVLVSIDNYA